MDKKEIEIYAEKIDSNIQEKVKEIDTNISYIIIGSLGFFITMLDKFIDVNHSILIPVMIISFVSLLFSFALFLYSKHSMTKKAADMLDFIDDKLLLNLGNVESEQELLRMWRESNDSITKNRKNIYILLGIGVFLQVIFFTTNIFLGKREKEKEVQQNLKIEIITKDTGATKPITKLFFDTIKTH